MVQCTAKKSISQIHCCVTKKSSFYYISENMKSSKFLYVCVHLSNIEIILKIEFTLKS